jgi:hypothetical protein
MVEEVFPNYFLRHETTSKDNPVITVVIPRPIRIIPQILMALAGG